MNNSIVTVLVGLGGILMVYLLVKAMLKANRKIGYNYVVKFSDVTQLPSLEDDSTLREHLRVVSHADNVYVVQSKWNDKKIKDYLVSKHDLEQNQVVVQSAQLSGAAGMI